MLHSMTGFGSAQARIEGVDYVIEIRSVNGRYFKASIRLPEMWLHVGTELEKTLRQRLSRGTVNLTLRMRSENETAAHTVNQAALRHYVEQARLALPADARLDAGTMLMLPGVCEPPLADETYRTSWPALAEVVAQAIESVVEMRRREGEALHADLMAHCQGIAEQLALIEARKDTVVTGFHKRLLARVQELVNAAQLTVDQQDLVREVAVFAERCDISEEIVRLRSHLDQFRLVSDQQEQAGRKLDFIGQEMLREANTIASKGSDAEIARAIVEIKAGIDRIKEQVQNVE